MMKNKVPVVMSAGARVVHLPPPVGQRVVLLDHLVVYSYILLDKLSAI